MGVIIKPEVKSVPTNINIDSDPFSDDKKSYNNRFNTILFRKFI